MTTPRREADYAALGRFLDGYLHQDFVAEHGDAARAARAFAAVAPEAERLRVATDLARFVASAEGEPMDAWRARLNQIGGAWRPRSVDDLRAIVGVLGRPAG